MIFKISRGHLRTMLIAAFWSQKKYYRFCLTQTVNSAWTATTIGGTYRLTVTSD